ncbi:MAG: hypothetical protein NT159_06500 [Proteobacteria bacterium]|nr:hypothetical protein [Pseudomonadota bacterium]
MEELEAETKTRAGARIHGVHLACGNLYHLLAVTRVKRRWRQQYHHWRSGEYVGIRMHAGTNQRQIVGSAVIGKLVLVFIEYQGDFPSHMIPIGSAVIGFKILGHYQF